MDSWACNCIGPQNGQPLCPCQMRGVQQIDGRWVKIQDLGPVQSLHAIDFKISDETKQALKDIDDMNRRTAQQLAANPIVIG